MCCTYLRYTHVRSATHVYYRYNDLCGNNELSIDQNLGSQTVHVHTSKSVLGKHFLEMHTYILNNNKIIGIGLVFLDTIPYIGYIASAIYIYRIQKYLSFININISVWSSWNDFFRFPFLGDKCRYDWGWLRLSFSHFQLGYLLVIPLTDSLKDHFSDIPGLEFMVSSIVHLWYLAFINF